MGRITLMLDGKQVNVDVDDVLGEIDTSDLEHEVLSRFDSDLVREGDDDDASMDFEEEEEDISIASLEYARSLSGESLRRFLCDLAYLGYHSSKVEIMNVINERI